MTGGDEPQVTVTARYLLDRGLWERACEMTGLNEWAVNEGRMDAEDTVTLTLEQAIALGLPAAARRTADARPVIVRAVQTCGASPAQWDAWDEEGRYWYLRFRFGYGSAECAGTPERWDTGSVLTGELSFRDDDDMAGVISLEEFCERAGLELRLT